ncbi:receptor-type guanylate cyclase gcy-12-like [Gigantopelta aegis]|uniref:receptor-type guanylate cyclase gcy-12-like n=1 Tax=Gigantopelta aegis TaxID=1735272 RepID=UPI001B88D987|nr:receptor-type guanylate cyclase gcy-12-like [Gigantopelta aegis]
MTVAMMWCKGEQCFFLVIVTSFLRKSWQMVNISGAGASFPLNVYTSWMPGFETYRHRFKDVDITYESIGSGGGKARIKNETGPPVDYAGSDSPLSDEDYQKYPDLEMFPTMAGAVVCVFNLPGILHLNMTIHQLARIYSGQITWWNDSSLVEINPKVTLPHKKIITIARRDKSGTTEIFTRTISAVDSIWQQQYGVFSSGLDDNDKPYHWDPEAVRVFGLTNKGLSGMLLSIRYSIGYLILSEAASTKLGYAFLQNRAGHFIAPTTTAVQKAMTATISRFKSKMTASLSNPLGNKSYPMAGYTYFIIRKTKITNCETAKELVRYIEWFFTNRIAKEYCLKSNMVPLPFSLYHRIINMILYKVTCHGHNVHAMIRAENNKKSEIIETWELALYICASLFGVLVIAGAVYYAVIKTKTWREVLENKWKIESFEIDFCSVSMPKFNTRTTRHIVFIKNKIQPSPEGDFHPVTPTMPSQVGEWQGKMVYLKSLEMHRYLSYDKKKKLLWMAKTIQHKNVTRFYGISHLNDVYHSVMDYHTKGSLSQFLHQSNLKTNNDLNFSISYEIVSGMKFLHKNNIVHGDLCSKNCYFDNNWSLKISDWHCEILEARTRKHVDYDNIKNVTTFDDKAFWTAPELLQRNGVVTKSSDVYSFGMAMHEIFSRNELYSEFSNSKSPGEVLVDIISTSLRPRLSSKTPYMAQVIMELAWDSDAEIRPSFATIEDKIMKTSTRGHVVVDSIIHLLEDYIGELEETVEKIETRDKTMSRDKTPDKQSNQTKLPDKNSNEAPVTSAIRLSSMPDGRPKPLEFCSVTVVVCNVYDFHSLVTRFPPGLIVEMLTKLFQALDDITLKLDIYRLDLSSTSYKAVAGLPETCENHAQIAAQAALEFATVARTVFVHPLTKETTRLKVGLSSGSVFVSCTKTGKQGCRYFFFGDALMISAKMAEYAHKTTVLASESTKELLGAEFLTVPKLDLIPWKDTSLRTFWLIGNKNSPDKQQLD